MRYKIAALTVALNPLYPTLRTRAAPYALPPECSLPVDIDATLPPPPPDLRPDDMEGDRAEYGNAGAIFYRRLLRYGGMMLHSSCVGTGGRAYLFSAPPGTGKSTHTAAWAAALPDAVILNDDQPALRLVEGQVLACGTPFSGRSPLNAPLNLPVGGIALLRRAAPGERDRITPLSPREALPGLYRETVRFLTASDAARMLDILTEVCARVPLWQLVISPSPAAARLSYEAMTGRAFPSPLPS